MRGEGADTTYGYARVIHESAWAVAWLTYTVRYVKAWLTNVTRVV